jgi:sigma-B regulation protein RsbU (phosphoserine phosphatase)
VPEQQLIHAVARDVTEHKRAQQLLASFADALKRKNTEMQEDLRMAREIQQTFIPQRYPTFPRHASPAESALRFCHHYQPATTLGGDFFDVFALSDTQVGVFICDVMGHGIRAALLTAIIRGLLQELRPVAADPGQFLTEINLALFASLKSATTTTFASAFYLVIEATTGQMLSANAGHPSPLWLRRDAGTVQPLQESEHAHGPALGFMSEAEYHTSRQRLGPTDAVLLFTDGLYEVEGREGDQFGLSRVQEKVQNCLQRTGSALVNEVVAEIQKFSSSGEFSDDVCLVAVEAVESVVRDSWSRDARSVLRAKP